MAQVITRMFTPPGKSGPPPAKKPRPPKMADAAKKAEAMSLKRARGMGRTQSIITSPLGISGEAEITKKKLLGE